MGAISFHKGRARRIAATATSWAIYGLALDWSRDKKRIPVDRFAEKVLPLIAASLRLAEPA